MSSDRLISPKTIEKFNLPKPDIIRPGRTLFVEQCPPDFSPKLAAMMVLRMAVQAGCERISVKRGRWRYEFPIVDIAPKEVIQRSASNLEGLGPSALKLNLSGFEMDRMSGQPMVNVRPPWNQESSKGSEAFDEGGNDEHNK